MQILLGEKKGEEEEKKHFAHDWTLRQLMKLKRRTHSTVGNPDNRNSHLLRTFLFPQEPTLIIQARLHPEG